MRTKKTRPKHRPISLRLSDAAWRWVDRSIARRSRAAGMKIGPGRFIRSIIEGIAAGAAPASFRDALARHDAEWGSVALEPADLEFRRGESSREGEL